MADTSNYTNQQYDAARKAAFRSSEAYAGGELTGSKDL